MSAPKRFPAAFYATAGGNEPVREWLLDRLVLLHGFVKKTKKTPKGEMDIARRRAREFVHG